MDAKNYTVLNTGKKSVWGLLVLLCFSGAIAAQDMRARPQDALKAEADSNYLRALDLYNADAYDSAAYWFKKAVDIREELYAGNPTVELGKANSNLGSSLLLNGDYFAAEPPLRRAIEVFQQLDTVPDFRVARARNELISAWTERGDFDLAERMAQLVYRRAKEEGDLENTLSGLLNLSNLFLRKEAYEASKKSSRELRSYVISLIAQASSAEREDFDLDLYLAYAHQNLALALTKTDSFTLAETYYLIAIPALMGSGDITNLQIARNNLALGYLRTNQLMAAKQSIDIARDLQQSFYDQRNLSVTEDHYGEYYLKRGEPAKALAAFQRAQAALLEGYQPTAPGDVPPDEALRNSPFQTDLFIYLGDQARALEALIEAGEDYDLPQLNVYQTSDRLIDFIRENHSGGATKLFWRNKVMPVYEAAIRRCHASGRTTEAFHFFEKSKAVLLYEALAGNDALSRLPDSLRMHYNILSQRITDAEGDTLAYLKATDERAAFQRQLEQDYPAYRQAGMELSVIEPMAFYERHLRPEGKILVHYLFGLQRTYAMTLDGDGVHTFDLGRSDSLSAIAQKMVEYFATSSEIVNDPAGYARAAHATYLAFIKPLHLPPGPLLLIPDGPLTYLPFSAMVTEAVTDARLGQLPYLLQRHPVSFIHSASLLDRERAAAPLTDPVTAFAPFTDGSATPDYPVLSFEQDELSELQKHFAIDLFRDQQASLNQFVEEAASARILHLSTHAFSTTGTASPHIAFHDSLLYLRDLYHQQISAEMVVLSACQTNIGQLASGEGVLGLGRGFLRAGAGSIIASLWNVNAFGSGHILRGFYDQLGQGSKRGMALHEAQLEYLADESISQRNKSPYLWAGFTYYGPDEALQLEPCSGGWGWLWLAVAGLLLLVGWLVLSGSLWAEDA
ncbi:CHAT domain-containing protein [Neolewinella agarilytica]|uniref:CHAT domain-containing protein n=1 Tax=Neolewinella agarilytica TaxID=478744 RepID=UPI002355B08F|nr:CHAT domain-containing protein [Neolewinella agarilytica]